MTVALQRSWTVEDFLAWEAGQELRYEFDGARAVAVTGGTLEHDAIQINLIMALGNRLRGKPCRVHGDSLKVRVMDSIRYPGAFVTCTLQPRGSTVVHEPVVIFEILSKGTARTDRMVKNREYAATASVRRYVMLEQSAMEGMVFVRSAAGDDWIGHMFGPEAMLHMPEIGVELSVAELYDGVDLPSGDPGQDDV